MTDQKTRKWRGRAKDREARDFDLTSLSARVHGRLVHRDYAAHFFRWGFAAHKFAGMRQNVDGGAVLDVGCGPDLPFMRTVLATNVPNRPALYVGVDMNPLRETKMKGVRLFGEFDFTWRWYELTSLAPRGFDVVVCYEVVEHMAPDAALRLLRGARELLKPGTGAFCLSTPVFDGHRARNHVHEFAVAELAGMIEEAGLVVEARHGTFANVVAVRKACTPAERDVFDRLSAYYRSDVLSCFLAPLYPDASRNNLWVLRRPA